MAKKSKLALQFVSNCKTNSKREKYLDLLQKYGNLTIFGSCNNRPFPSNRSMNKQYGTDSLFTTTCYGLSNSGFKFKSPSGVDRSINFHLFTLNFSEKHYFYLAFENSVCDYYVTEKFWRLKHLIVPVVLKRSILSGIVDDEYFIAADDFESPEALIERLQYLAETPQEYKK